MQRSLRVRLLVSILAFVLPASAAAGWLLVRVFANRLVRDTDVALREEADTVAELLGSPPTATMLESVLTHISAETDLGAGKQIVIRRGAALIGEAPPGAALRVANAVNGEMRIGTATTGPADMPITVQVAVPAAAAVHAAERLSWLLAIAVPCGVLVLTAGQWLVIGRTLRPLEAASQRMEAIGVGGLTTRMPVTNAEDEVGRMVQALNRMLDRVEHSVAQMQRFTADAAHELRTPLTVLRTGLDVTLARDRSPAEYRAALGEALSATERLSALAEDLLTLARLDAHLTATAAMTRIDLIELLQDLIDAAAARAADRGLRLALDPGESVLVRGRSPDLYRLLSNLIDNALRHAPPGSTIQLRGCRAGRNVEITVRDSGVGLPPGEESKVLERFYRGRGEQEPGSGLGLSIAQMIARAHGGELSIANHPEGGCVATLTLPGEN